LCLIQCGNLDIEYKSRTFEIKTRTLNIEIRTFDSKMYDFVVKYKCKHIQSVIILKNNYRNVKGKEEIGR